MTPQVSQASAPLPHLSRREAMTQDEREQKAPPCDCTRQDKDGNWYQECYCQNNGDLANAQAWCTEQNIHHAAMTEGGVWLSREDAEAIIAPWTTQTIPILHANAISRLRAKLEGQKP
jgi:hypothetical protein